MRRFSYVRLDLVVVFDENAEGRATKPYASETSTRRVTRACCNSKQIQPNSFTNTYNLSGYIEISLSAWEMSIPFKYAETSRDKRVRRRLSDSIDVNKNRRSKTFYDPAPPEWISVSSIGKSFDGLSSETLIPVGYGFFERIGKTRPRACWATRKTLLNKWTRGKNMKNCGRMMRESRMLHAAR